MPGPRRPGTPALEPPHACQPGRRGWGTFFGACAATPASAWGPSVEVGRFLGTEQPCAIFETEAPTRRTEHARAFGPGLASGSLARRGLSRPRSPGHAWSSLVVGRVRCRRWSSPRTVCANFCVSRMVASTAGRRRAADGRRWRGGCQGNLTWRSEAARSCQTREEQCGAGAPRSHVVRAAFTRSAWRA